MPAPYYKAVRGRFSIVGKEPDGDSIRFIADDGDVYRELDGAYRLRPGRDASVQLRFEAIDAPEIHYGSSRQPLGREARDNLLDWMGFQGVQYETGGRPYRVASASVSEVPGTIFTKGIDPNGRPISYATLETHAPVVERDQWMRVDETILERTLNYRMLAEGLAYLTLYTSTPQPHRKLFREIAAGARRENRGVWKVDATGEWTLENRDSVGPSGQLILPKLFRRCIDYLRDVEKGFRGELVDWLLDHSSGTRSENDRVLVHNNFELPLSSLLSQRNQRIAFAADPLDIAFVEK